MRRTLITLLCLSFLLTGCKAKELYDKASISDDLKNQGTTDLMKKAAEDEYTAPEDGRLTEAQIQMYLKVREHEQKIAEVAKEELKKHADSAEKKGEKSLGAMMDGFKALGSAADLMTADIRAAADLGFNTQEYLWVKGQVLAVSTAAMAEQFNKTMVANFDKAYGEAKKAHDEATDETTKKFYADMLATYEQSKQEMQQQEEQDPALAYNRQLLSKHENALNAYAAELAKFSDKPDEVRKSVEELSGQAEATPKQ